MKRVMLVIEEPKELMFLDTLLRRLKFDVEVVKMAVLESFLNFRPDVVIATAKGKKINGIDIAKKINPKGDGVKVFLLISGQSKLKPQDLMNVNIAGYLDTPINPHKVLELLSHHCKLDIQTLKDNLAKPAKTNEPKADTRDSTFIKSKEKQKDSTATVFANTDRVKTTESKYVNNKFLDFPTPQQAQMSRDKIQRKLEDIRKEEVPEDFDEQRRAFVKALFAKK